MQDVSKLQYIKNHALKWRAQTQIHLTDISANTQMPADAMFACKESWLLSQHDKNTGEMTYKPFTHLKHIVQML